MGTASFASIFTPHTHNEASVTCREGKNLCKPLAYIMNLFPDPNSENIFVMFETSRLPSATTSYNPNWPGKVVRSETAIGWGWQIIDFVNRTGRLHTAYDQGLQSQASPTQGKVNSKGIFISEVGTAFVCS